MLCFTSSGRWKTQAFDWSVNFPIVLLFLFSCQVMSNFCELWTAARKASLSFTISWSLLKFMFVESVCYLTISSFVTLFSCPQSFPASGSFPMSWLFASGRQSIGISALASVLPKNIQGLGLTVWSPCSSRDSQESFPAPQFKSITSSALSLLGFQLSHPYMTTEKIVSLTIQTLSAKFCLPFLIR